MAGESLTLSLAPNNEVKCELGASKELLTVSMVWQKVLEWVQVS